MRENDGENKNIVNAKHIQHLIILSNKKKLEITLAVKSKGTLVKSISINR